MYQGALLPSAILTGLYALFIFSITWLRPAWVPALPPQARQLLPANTAITLRLRLQVACKVLGVLLPTLLLIFLVLGTIFLGIATPTEGGAMGAVGALCIALLKRKLSLTLFNEALANTTQLSCFVMFILIGSTVFGLVFRGLNGDLWIERLLLDLPGGKTGFLIAANFMIFLLAFFLDFFELAFIIVPLLAPVAQKLGIDLVWFGVMLGVNMQTSFMHPPFGFALFYLRSVAPESIKTSDIYRGAIPYVLIQILMVALLIAFPEWVSHLETSAETAAPLQLQLPDF
jgi:tripartite ATP-independent transporter DctM subunit